MEKTKKCKRCGKELDISMFYVHKQMVDGHLNFCKECVKKRVNSHRRKNVQRIREYDRERGKLKKRKILKQKITYRRNKEVPGYKMCHDKLDRYVALGKIIRPNRCQCCHKKVKTEAHHFDYTKPLDVVWLCTECHRNYHTGKSDFAEQIKAKVNKLISNF